MNKQADKFTKPELSIKDVSNKIMGIVYGCVLGEIFGMYDNKDIEENATWGFSTDQLILLMGTLIETKTMHVNTFMQKFQVYGNKGMLELEGEHNNIDEYCKEIVTSYEALSDPAKLSFEQYNKYNTENSLLSTCDNTPLIRNVMIGIYNDWDSYSFATTMSTHADHKCISAGIIIASAARNMLIGRPTNISEIVTDTAAMVLAMGKMTNKNDINEYMRFTSKEYCTDLSLLNLKGDKKYVYKCMSQSMFALNKMSYIIDENINIPTHSGNFKKILLEIREQRGDSSTNCALSGALMGCEIGYKNLPEDWLKKINKNDMLVLNNIVIDYLKHLGFLDINEINFDNILK
jgi:ADP-ribosylglycohydrolase